MSNVSGVDVDGQTSNVISSNWEVTDPDSNIDFCEWSIGKSYFYWYIIFALYLVINPMWKKNSTIFFLVGLITCYYWLF